MPDRTTTPAHRPPALSADTVTLLGQLADKLDGHRPTAAMRVETLRAQALVFAERLHGPTEAAYAAEHDLLAAAPAVNGQTRGEYAALLRRLAGGDGHTTDPLRALLVVVLEALAIPHPATIGDGEVHGRILADRVMHARIALENVLQRGDDPEWSADYLRARLGEHPPTGYRAAGTPRAEGAGQ